MGISDILYLVCLFLLLFADVSWNYCLYNGVFDVTAIVYYISKRYVTHDEKTVYLIDEDLAEYVSTQRDDFMK